MQFITYAWNFFKNKSNIWQKKGWIFENHNTLLNINKSKHCKYIHSPYELDVNLQILWCTNFTQLQRNELKELKSPKALKGPSSSSNYGSSNKQRKTKTQTQTYSTFWRFLFSIFSLHFPLFCCARVSLAFRFSFEWFLFIDDKIQGRRHWQKNYMCVII